MSAVVIPPKRIIPGARLLRIVAAWAALALVAVLLRLLDQAWVPTVSDGLTQLVSVAVGVTFFLALWDFIQVRRIEGIKVQRQVTKTLPVNVWSEVELNIQHPCKVSTRVEVFDHYPNGADIGHLPQTVNLQPGQVTRLRYRLRPEKRGDATFALTQLLIPSTLKLWTCSHCWGEPTAVRVYPDFAAITRYQLLATDNHTSQLGIKRQPRRGEGLEFHQLRDYRGGDVLRQIDWKATVRRQKLISREYQEERDQQIFFMLDCGRTMRSQDGHLSHFDHALNALLLLSYVALRQGDAVGLMSFGGVKRWLPPQKSASAVNTILNTVYDLQPTTQASDYHAAAQAVLSRQRKRSLVVILSNLKDQSGEALAPILHALRQRHLVLIANLREEVLDQTLAHPVDSFDDALSYLGANNYLAQRQQGQQYLRNRGLLSLDVLPSELAVKVVNSYLEIKRSGCL